MPKQKGRTLVAKWKRGEKLTRKQAIIANCWICNGGEGVDCKGYKTCPLYPFFGYQAVKDDTLEEECLK